MMEASGGSGASRLVGTTEVEAIGGPPTLDAGINDPSIGAIREGRRGRNRG